MSKISIKRNALMNMLLTFSNMVFPLISFPYVARVLSVDGIGKVNFFNTIGNYAVMFAGLGLSTYGIKICANNRDSKTKLSKVVKELLILKTLSTAMVVIILVGSIPFVDKFRTDIVLFWIQIILVLCNIFNIEWLFSGLEQYSYITKRSIIFKSISLLLLFLLVKDKSDYILYSAITVFSTCGNYFFNIWYSKKYIDYHVSGSIELKKHLRPTLILFASILAVSVYTSLDTIMLGFYCGDTAVGYYTVAIKVKGILLSLVNSISTVLLPRLSYYVNSGETKTYKLLLRKAIIVIMTIAVPLTFFFVIEAVDSVILLGGNEYLASAPAMRILMPILILSGFSNITGNQILLPYGKENCFMKAVVGGSIVDLILNVLFMPHYGFMGVAVATLLAELTQVSIQICYSKPILKGNIDGKELCKVVSSSILASCGTLFMSKLIPSMSAFYRLFILGTIFFSLYCSTLYMLKAKYILEYTNKAIAVVKSKNKHE